MEQPLNDIVDSLRACMPDRPPATILITGCSSGIGLYACKVLRLVNPENRLILVARNQAKAELTKKEIESVLPGGSKIIAMSCDMTSLASVRTFCKNLRQLVRPSFTENDTNPEFRGIDAVCLNAAVLVSADAEPSFTEDGLEVTFQTNYLAPFLMTNLIFDLINPGGRIVVTTSGLHIGPKLSFDGMIDEATEKPKKFFLMVDGSEYHYKKCYSLTKLCVTAFCMALHRKLQHGNIVINCFTPGLLPSSGLFRYQNQKIVSFFNCADETIEWGGGALAWMAVADEPGRRGGQFYRAPMGSSRMGGKYGREFCPSPVSKEACNEKNQDLLWNLSAQLAGIPEDLID